VTTQGKTLDLGGHMTWSWIVHF